jgi:23S rRNA (cytosine1962-C5)-methyltransferase
MVTQAMHELLEAAVSKRAPLLAGGTDAVRLVDGAGDGLPGVFLESFAGRLLLSTTGTSVAPLLHGWLSRQDAACYWKRLDPHSRDSPAHLCGPRDDDPFLIRENGLLHEISFHSGYSQGIFLDQRDNRAEVRRRSMPGQRLLNTFAYTGAFSLAAAAAGAETTTLDLSRPFLDWAARNFSHNSLDPAAHHFCKGDTFHWLRRFARQGRLFDAIILDPPTFSRDDKGRIFRAASDFGELAALAARALAPGGWMLCCTNFRGITPADFERRITNALPRPMRATHTPMPPDFTDAPYLKSLWLCRD